MTPRKLNFFIAKPSERGMDEWVVYEAADLARPLFVGSQEAAEFVADQRNDQALARYKGDSIGWTTDLKNSFDHRSASFMAKVEEKTRMMEEILRRSDELINYFCLSALSLPI